MLSLLALTQRPEQKNQGDLSSFLERLIILMMWPHLFTNFNERTEFQLVLRVVEYGRSLASPKLPWPHFCSVNPV